MKPYLHTEARPISEDGNTRHYIWWVGFQRFYEVKLTFVEGDSFEWSGTPIHHNGSLHIPAINEDGTPYWRRF